MLGEDIIHGFTDCNQCQDLWEGKHSAFSICKAPKLRSLNGPYHDRENDGSHRRFEDPEQSQTEGLNEGEEMDPSLWDVTQINQIRLVFGWHKEELQAIHELNGKKTKQIYTVYKCVYVVVDEVSVSVAVLHLFDHPV